jgi:preprotein translocase subunit YajC
MTLALIAQNQSEPANALVTLAPLLLIFVAMYFLMIRPQRRRMMQQRELLESLEVGDEVITVGGVLGVIREIDDEYLTLEVSPGTQIRIVRSAVARKLVFDDEEELGEESSEEATDER